VCFEESPKEEIGREKKCVANKTPLQNKGKKERREREEAQKVFCPL
jgi:hypothetical protein